MTWLHLILGAAVVIAVWLWRVQSQASQFAHENDSQASGTDRDSQKMAATRPSPSNVKVKEAVPKITIEPLLDFNWKTTEPIQLRPFKPIYHITMGLQLENPSNLILVDRNYKERVEARRELIRHHPQTVLGCIPEGASAVREVYTYLTSQYLPTRYPSMFNARRDLKQFQNLVTGKAFPLSCPKDPREALAILGETVEDDMFLVQDTEHGHRSVAFVCCHPSGFNPSQKLGKGLREIHGPVPHYDKIGPSMERFFGRLEVGKNVKRMNWSVVATPELFSPSKNHVHVGEDVKEDDQIDIQQAHLRSELQTLSRLPQTQALLFSFKTLMYPLRDIKQEGSGPALADAIEGLTAGNAPGMWVYKSAVRWGKSTCEYLRS